MFVTIIYVFCCFMLYAIFCAIIDKLFGFSKTIEKNREQMELQMDIDYLKQK